jgi:hypothetical protein
LFLAAASAVAAGVATESSTRPQRSQRSRTMRTWNFQNTKSPPLSSRNGMSFMHGCPFDGGAFPGALLEFPLPEEEAFPLRRLGVLADVDIFEIVIGAMYVLGN